MGTQAVTDRGLVISCHRLPYGRDDWVLSSTHSAWSMATATQLARMLWADYEVVVGRTPAVIHVLTR